MLFTWSLYLCRRRPTLPHTYACSTIGPAGLNFRVRDGNGCFPRGKITGFVDVDAHRVAWLQAWVARTTCYVDLEAFTRRLSLVPKSRALFCEGSLAYAKLVKNSPLSPGLKPQSWWPA